MMAFMGVRISSAHVGREGAARRRLLGALLGSAQLLLYGAALG